MTPTVIAHRGASGHRPEHTLGAYDLAFRLGADSVELDLVATRDGVVVCLHDLELSRTTDVADHPELAHLRRTVEVKGEPVTGWWVHDLTFEQLRLLRCRERWPKRRPTSAAYDGREPVPTLREVLALVDAASERAGRRLGLHLELKEARQLEEHGLWLPELVADVDTSAATWMGFNERAMRALTARGPRVLLLDKAPRRGVLKAAAEWADAVGVRRSAVLPPDRKGRVSRPSDVVGKAHRLGLGVLTWTHRAENRWLPTNLRIGTSPRAHGDAAAEARMLYEAGVDGVITDFPELALRGRTDAGLAPVATAAAR